ncbi:hypothetical protein ACC771_21695, partial [Rhizobium ruizarguesonis]
EAPFLGDFDLLGRATGWLSWESDRDDVRSSLRPLSGACDSCFSPGRRNAMRFVLRILKALALLLVLVVIAAIPAAG